MTVGSQQRGAVTVGSHGHRSSLFPRLSPNHATRGRAPGLARSQEHLEHLPRPLLPFPRLTTAARRCLHRSPQEEEATIRAYDTETTPNSRIPKNRNFGFPRDSLATAGQLALFSQHKEGRGGRAQGSGSPRGPRGLFFLGRYTGLKQHTSSLTRYISRVHPLYVGAHPIRSVNT